MRFDSIALCTDSCLLKFDPRLKFTKPSLRKSQNHFQLFRDVFAMTQEAYFYSLSWELKGCLYMYIWFYELL